MEKNSYYQEYLAAHISELNSLKEIVRVDWSDVTEEYPGEYISETITGIEIEDSERNVFRMAIHKPERNRILFDTDCIILNFLAQKVFKENNVYCPYIFPLNLEYVCGLINDARQLLRMKNRGEDLAAFEFVYCLMDIRKGEWVNIGNDIYNDSFGCGKNENDWDKLLYFIQHG